MIAHQTIRTGALLDARGAHKNAVIRVLREDHSEPNMTQKPARWNSPDLSGPAIARSRTSPLSSNHEDDSFGEPRSYKYGMA